MRFRRYLHFADRQLALTRAYLRAWRLPERWHRLTAGAFRQPAIHYAQAGEFAAMASPHAASGSDDRAYWLAQLARIASPVLENLARGTLHASMPVECGNGSRAERSRYTHLEAFARLLAGIAPWLELDDDTEPEAGMRRQFANLARRALHAATDPASPDSMNFSTGSQPLVDAAYLALAILRAPRALWQPLAPEIRQQVLRALRETRRVQPVENNWLLFSAVIEATLKQLDGQWRPECVDYALRRHEQWYKGDGAYGDGPHFCWDYYNSFVIHPMLLNVMQAVAGFDPEWDALRAAITERAVRYAAIQERLISPEAAFPAFGRSIAYRTGAFHHLAQMALIQHLPLSVAPAQVRCALTAVMHRLLDAPGTFSDDGWLRIGLAGHQPRLGEHYISTGSLYACALVLLPLGLAPQDDFWRAPPANWSSRKIFAGADVDADKALEA